MASTHGTELRDMPDRSSVCVEDYRANFFGLDLGPGRYDRSIGQYAIRREA